MIGEPPVSSRARLLQTKVASQVCESGFPIVLASKETADSGIRTAVSRRSTAVRGLSPVEVIPCGRPKALGPRSVVRQATCPRSTHSSELRPKQTTSHCCPSTTNLRSHASACSREESSVRTRSRNSPNRGLRRRGGVRFADRQRLDCHNRAVLERPARASRHGRRCGTHWSDGADHPARGLRQPARLHQ